MYLGADPEKVLEWVKSQSDVEHNPGEAALQSMVKGYVEELLSSDLERYKILEIEHHFERRIVPEISGISEEVKLCGSIDMIVLEEHPKDSEFPLLWGFEHKTCKNYRSGAYAKLDDQLRVYNWALYKYLGELKEAHKVPQDTQVGGVVLNETRKLLRKFENHRQVYYEDRMSLWRYINGLSRITDDMRATSHDLKKFNINPEPCADFMSCQMCEYNTICETYGSRLPGQNEILQEFEGEFQVRECDHLDEKVEREVMK